MTIQVLPICYLDEACDGQSDLYGEVGQLGYFDSKPPSLGLRWYLDRDDLR
jgi:hypothetical protein